MFCIVLKFYYLCVVIGDKPVKTYHKFLKYSPISKQPLLLRSPKGGLRGSGKKSIAMNNLFSEKTFAATPGYNREQGDGVKKMKP